MTGSLDALLAREPARSVIALLNRDGEEARIVGGAVRDALLGRDVGEIDIATTAVPDIVIARATAAHIKAVPTGIDHGTVTLVVAGVPVEVTTLREDVATFGRKATVRFGRDFAVDARRRDFTMNALSLSPNGAVHDPVGGRADLEARRVRFIGDADARIAEDYLRILRFFRFTASVGDGVCDAAGYVAAIRGRAGLAMLSAERLRAETMKLLVASDVVRVLAAMAGGGFLLALTGGVTHLRSVAAMAAAEARCDLPADAVRRLAALAVLTVEDVSRLKARLRLSNAEAKRLAAMAAQWPALVGGDERAVRRVIYAVGPDVSRDALLLAAARTDGGGVEVAALAQVPSRWTAPVFPIKADDFLARGVARGPALGRALAAAERAWIAADFPADRAVLETIVADAGR